MTNEDNPFIKKTTTSDVGGQASVFATESNNPTAPGLLGELTTDRVSRFDRSQPAANQGSTEFYHAARASRSSQPQPLKEPTINRLDELDKLDEEINQKLNVEANPKPNGVEETAEPPAEPEITAPISEPAEIKGETVSQTKTEAETETEELRKPARFKAFAKRHLHAIVAILIIIIVTIALFFVDRCMRTVNLTLPATGLDIVYDTNDNGELSPKTIPARILAYNADIGSPAELLYYIDTTITVRPNTDDSPATDDNPATVFIRWEIPDTARYRSTYNEICLLDSGVLNKKVNDYCFSIETTYPNANYSLGDEAAESGGINLPADAFNKLSCTYYVPAHSVGLIAWWSGWDKLKEDQLVGCAGSAKTNGTTWGDESFINAIYGFALGNMGSTANLNSSAGKGLSGLTMQNFFQSILNGQGSDIYAGDIIKNSLSGNFSYSDSTHVIDLSTSGVAAGQSCTFSYTQTNSRPALPNGSDNSTTQTYTCIPVFSVDRYGRVTNVTTQIISYDAVHGNEVVGVTGSNSGLIRSGAGSFADPYTLATSINSKSLKIANNQIAVIAPQCTEPQRPGQIPGDPPDTSKNKLQWTVDADGFGKFICVHDVDNQQLSMNQSSTTNSNNITTTTTTITLTGDNPSQIQFVSLDTFYTSSSGITVNNTNNTIAINAPTCSGNTQVLTWNGTAFVCVSGTDWSIAAQGTAGTQSIYDNSIVTFLNGTSGGGLTATRSGNNIKYDLNATGVTAGQYGPVADGADPTNLGGYELYFPRFTVNTQGQLTNAGVQKFLSLKPSNGFYYDPSTGELSLPGLTTTCPAGSGLHWTGSVFDCTTAYRWRLSANGGTTVNIAHDGLVNFSASGTSGLSVARSGSNDIAYSVNLAAGGGLVMYNNGISLPRDCTTGQLLKWNGSGWVCDNDKDTISQRCDATDIATPIDISGIWVQVDASSGFNLGPVTSAHIEMTWVGPNWQAPDTTNHYLVSLNLVNGCEFRPNNNVPFVAIISMNGFMGYTYTASTVGMLLRNGNLRLDEWIDPHNVNFANPYVNNKNPIGPGVKITVDLFYLNRSTIL